MRRGRRDVDTRDGPIETVGPFLPHASSTLLHHVELPDVDGTLCVDDDEPLPARVEDEVLDGRRG